MIWAIFTLSHIFVLAATNDANDVNVTAISIEFCFVVYFTLASKPVKMLGARQHIRSILEELFCLVWSLLSARRVGV